MPLVKPPKLPNIWSRRVERFRRGVPRPKWSKIVTFDYQQAAEKCHIKLHYVGRRGKRRVVQCTVAQAIRNHLRPGKWIVPRGIPPTVFQALNKTKTEYVDYRNHDPYTTVLEYNLINLNINANGPAPKLEPRGPRIFKLDCFSNDSTQALAVVSEAFKSLSRGQTSTFAIVTNYLFDRSKGSELATQQNGAFQQQDESHDMAKSLSLATDSLDILSQSNNDSITSVSTIDNISQESAGIQNLQQQEEELQGNDSDLVQPVEKKTDAGFFTTEATNIEDNLEHRELQSHQESRGEIHDTIEQSDSIPGDADAQLGSSNQQTGEEPFITQHTSQAFSSGSDSLGEDAEEHASESANDDYHSVLDATPDVYEDLPNAEDEEQQSRSDDNSDPDIISIKGPFARQIMDSSLVLTNRRTPGYGHLQGTDRILAWTSKYMPHLWPNVIAACMPPGNRIQMTPRSLGASIQYVITPTIDQAVKSNLRDLVFKKPEKWV